MEEIQREELSETNLPIGTYTTDAKLIAVYPSVDIASEQTGMDADKIMKCMSGEIKTVRNFVFLAYDYRLSPKKIAKIISKRQKNLHNSNGYQPKLKGSTVEQYDLKGNFIDSYSSVTSAAQITGLSQPSISLVINGKQYTTGGFIFLRFSNESQETKSAILKNRLEAFQAHKGLPEKKSETAHPIHLKRSVASRKMNPSRTGRKKLVNILYFDAYGEFIEEFNNAQDVFHRLGLSLTTVRNLCEGKSKSFSEGVLLLRDDYETFEDAELAAHERLSAKRKRYSGRKGKRVSQFNMHGLHINTFKSAKEASEQTNITYVRLNQGLNGHTLHVDNFIFIYSDLFDSIESMTQEVLYRLTLSRAELRQHIIDLNNRHS